MQLNQQYINKMQRLLGTAADAFFASLEQAPESAIRFNIRKGGDRPDWASDLEHVPWALNGYYTPARPSFTYTPQLHSGQFYVQDPSSMIHELILQKIFDEIGNFCKNPKILDACAAPGGKTTAVINSIPDSALVVANEFVKSRANILRENLMKWGYPALIVTNSPTNAFRQVPEMFDVVVADVPCSGEGMMRKSTDAVAQWSERLIEECQSLQRGILADCVATLKVGGYLVYSTCTFNREEDECQVEWLCNTYGMKSVDLGISGVGGISNGIETTEHCYRFMPHLTRGEGLFVALLKKTESVEDEDYMLSDNHSCTVGKKCKKDFKKDGKDRHSRSQNLSRNHNSSRLQLLSRDNEAQLGEMLEDTWLERCGADRYGFFECGRCICALPDVYIPIYEKIKSCMKVMTAGVEVATIKGGNIIPEHGLALNLAFDRMSFPEVALDETDALKYLRRETIDLPANTGRGYVVVTHAGLPLGFVKSLGNRCNNLYPQEWRIRN